MTSNTYRRSDIKFVLLASLNEVLRVHHIINSICTKITAGKRQLFLFHVEALEFEESSSESHTFSGRQRARRNAKQERVAKITYTA